MKFVFESASLCEGLVAPVARCFAAALDELGLEPVVVAEPELARALAAERAPIVEPGRERELEARDHAASSSRSKVASIEERAESVGPSRTARRESGEVARLRLRPREPERSRVESIGASSIAGEAASIAGERDDLSLVPDSRGATAHARAPRAAELDSTVRSSGGESATQSERAGFDAARVAELLAKRIEATPGTAGRVSVQPRAGADASSSSPSPSEEPIEVEPASRELASSDGRATNLVVESPAALSGFGRDDASELASVRPPAPAHAGEASPSREPASLRIASADETPRAVDAPSHARRLRVRPRPRLDEQELARESSPEPIEPASVERSDLVGDLASSMSPRATRSIASVTEPIRVASLDPHSASEVADARVGSSSSRSTIRRADPPSSSRPSRPSQSSASSTATPSARLDAGRIPVVARGSEALALLESEAVDASTAELARRDEALASPSTSMREWPSALRATHPRTLELAGSPRAARPGAEPTGPLASVTTHPASASASASPSGSATTRESSFAPPSAPLVADSIDGELERTLTAVLRNAARRHGIDV